MTKSLMIAAAATLAIATGATALQSTPAEAGKFNLYLNIGGGHGYGHAYRNNFYGGCHEKRQRIWVKGHWEYGYWVPGHYVWRTYTRCY